MTFKATSDECTTLIVKWVAEYLESKMKLPAGSIMLESTHVGYDDAAQSFYLDTDASVGIGQLVPCNTRKDYWLSACVIDIDPGYLTIGKSHKPHSLEFAFNDPDFFTKVTAALDPIIIQHLRREQARHARI